MLKNKERDFFHHFPVSCSAFLGEHALALEKKTPFAKLYQQQ